VRQFIAIVLFTFSNCLVASPATNDGSHMRRPLPPCVRALTKKKFVATPTPQIVALLRRQGWQPASLNALLGELRTLRITKSSHRTATGDNIGLSKASAIITEVIRNPHANAEVLVAAAETIGALRYNDAPVDKAKDLLTEIKLKSPSSVTVIRALAAAIFQIFGSKVAQAPENWLPLYDSVLDAPHLDGFAIESLSAALARLTLYSPDSVRQALLESIETTARKANTLHRDKKRKQQDSFAAGIAVSVLSRSRAALVSSRRSERAGNAVVLFVGDLERQELPARLPTRYIPAEEALYNDCNRFAWDEAFFKTTSGKARQLATENRYFRDGMEEFKLFTQRLKNPYVPKDYVASSDFPLGKWAISFRVKLDKGQLSPFLAQELQEAGFVFDVFAARFDEAIAFLEQYVENNGTAEVPQDWFYPETENQREFHLGWWVSTQRRFRKEGKLTKEKIERLDALGMRWDPRKEDYEANWNKRFALLEAYAKAHRGDPNCPRDYTTSSGIKLGLWVQNVTVAQANGLLRKDRAKRLEDLGLIWELRRTKLQDRYATGLQLLKAYARQEGTAHVPKLFETSVNTSDPNSEVFPLGAWLDQMKEKQIKNELTTAQKKELEALGVQWRIRGRRIAP
jgi:hypothetical protein